MERIKFKITGTAPLLMHSDRLSNPLDPLTKAHKVLTAKRKKTDEDHEAIAKSEWRSSLYYNEGMILHIPGANIEACLVDAAKMQRLGTAFKKAVLVEEMECPLIIDGKSGLTVKAIESKYQQYSLTKSVVVSRARIMRTRPFFKSWAIEFTVNVATDIVDVSDLINAAKDAGDLIGLCDWRPRYGRFSCEQIG